MLVNYLSSVLKIPLEKTPKDTWLFCYLQHMIGGLSLLKKKRRKDPKFWYERGFVEQDPTFLKQYLESKQKNCSQEGMEKLCTQWNDFLDVLIQRLAEKEVQEWIEKLFPGKNVTPCLKSDWYVPFERFTAKDREGFLRGEDASRIKNYLFFTETMESLFIEGGDPFRIQEPFHYILFAKFDNMLLKICGYHGIVITKADLEKNRILFMASCVSNS